MISNLHESIFNFAYHEALHDATLQKAYVGKKEDISYDARDVVRRYINNILEGNQPDFMVTAQEVNKAVNDTNFTFGNIQKLINMTAKYIYMGCYTNSELRNNFACCHCPMDSFMIKIIRKEYLKLNGNDRKDLLLRIPVGENSYSTDASKISWSKIRFEENNSPTSRLVYENFQEMVSRLSEEEGVFPLEYDFRWKNIEDSKT